MNLANVSVYSEKVSSIDDYLYLYSKEILAGVRCSRVESAFLTYVTGNIEPTGWHAIWRSAPKSSGLSRDYDFFVEVVDVSQCKLEAIVQILKPLQQFNDLLVEEDRACVQEINSFIKKDCATVPLLELYSVADETLDDQFEKTAEVIEHVRFFYKNIWRPWDGDDEEDCVFVNCYLEPRLKLHFDSASGSIPLEILERIRVILNEASENQRQIEGLDDEMGYSESEDLSEEDVLKSLQLRLKQDELKKELQLFEIPALRALVTQKKLGIQNLPKGKRANGETIVHIVASKMLAGMVRELDDAVQIEHHTSFARAISAACENDVVWIFPGTYVCEGIGWFEDSVQILGKGSSPDDVVVEVDGNTDIFINLSCDKIKLSNLTLKATKDQYCTLMVHRGYATLEQCIIVGGQIGIGVNSGAEVDMKRCFIKESQNCGIDVHSSATLSVRESVFVDCQHLTIAVECEKQRKNRYVYVIENTVVGRIKNTPVVLYPAETKLIDLCSSDFKILDNVASRFDWIKVEDNKFNCELNSAISVFDGD